MNINELPTEMLMEIFRYLPSLCEVSLVNQRFYSIACKLSEPEVCLVLDENLFTKKENRALLRSIKRTSRKIKEIYVHLPSVPDRTIFELMVSIIAKFSDSIKQFKYHGELEYLDFILILWLIPEVVHLSLHYLGTPANQSRQKMCRLMSNNEDLNLHKLKTLKCEQCDQEFVVLFNRLPAGVLTELKMDLSHLNHLKVLFTRQINIKTLEVRWYSVHDLTPSVAANLFDNQKLESLAWLGYLDNLQNIFSKQSNLKYLDLEDVILPAGNKELLDVMTDHLPVLETLSIYLTQVPVGDLKKINKLKNLRELTIATGGDTRYIEEFCKLDNSRLTTLNIQRMSHLPDSVIADLAKSVPNLRVFRFESELVYSNFIAIMKSFNFVKILHLNSSAEESDNEYEIINETSLLESNFTNSNLIELKITFPLPYKRRFLKKLSNDYRNVKKLIINSMKPLTSSQFKLILTRFKKLESFSLLDGASKLNMDDMDCLKQHKNGLQFISLKDKRGIKRIPETNSWLHQIFVVKFTLYGLQMAVDKHIMESEQIDEF